MVARLVAALASALAAVACVVSTARAGEGLVVGGARVTRGEDPPVDPGARGLGTRGRRCGRGPGASGGGPRRLGGHVARRVSTVGSAVERAFARGEITAEQRDAYLGSWSHARRVRTQLVGARRAELSSVIAIAEGLAARGLLSAGRMPAIFLTIERNAEYWAAHPIPRIPPAGRPCAAGVGHKLPRVAFAGDPVVFQWYPGQGLQIQVLGSFGKANALANACLGIDTRPGTSCRKDELAALLDRLVALAARRGGFTAWEYYFPFGGAPAPWLSGMAQATAMQALTKGYQVLGNRVYLDAARSALGAFATGPPVGVRVRADGGNHYLIYSFAPRQRVLNAFLQSLIGLYDYAKLSGDQAAWALFRAGDRAARREVPRYDTGAWSLYSPGEGEANLDYHKLVRDFLRGLCERTGSAVYCRTAARFTDFLSQPPRLRFAGPLASRRGRPAVVQVVISKISCVRIRVRRGGRPVFEAGYVFPRGRRAFSFTPRASGTYAIEVQATDPAGNRAILSGTLHATS